MTDAAAVEAEPAVKLSKTGQVPLLGKEGAFWVNLTEAGEILGITRQHAYKRAKAGGFKTLRQLGSKPAFVVNTKELDQIIAARATAAEEKISEE